MAVKLFLVARDLQTTRGFTDTKSFVMGSKTVAAVGDGYRRRLMSSTITLVNMYGRRELP
jgi:type IV pilus assembly protein PilW